jgi:hypothetical protein
MYTKAMSCTKKIPKFKSRDEEADFWDTHSPLDYGEWKEVKIKVAQPLVHILGVRLEAKTITQLGEIGRKKGLGASTLARMWLLERLDQENTKRTKRGRTA